jgi:hypothetical protein
MKKNKSNTLSSKQTKKSKTICHSPQRQKVHKKGAVVLVVALKVIMPQRAPNGRPYPQTINKDVRTD